MKKSKFLFSLLMLLTFSLGTMWATEYQLVTSASDLVNGAHYVIGSPYNSNNQFIATDNNANNRKLTTATVTNNKVTATSSMMTFTLGGSTGAWTFATDNYGGTAGYLNATSTTSNNYLKVVANLDSYAYFTVDIAADGTATITCNGKTSRHIMYLNGTTCFACYNTQTGQQYVKPRLYKEVTTVPTVSILQNGSTITSVDFGDVEEDTETSGYGYSVVQTIDVKGSNLTDNVYLEITSAGGGIFDIWDPRWASPTVNDFTITPTAGAIDTTIEISAYTKSTGLKSGVLNVSSLATSPDFTDFDINLSINLLEPVAPTSFSILPASVSLEPGQTQQLTTTSWEPTNVTNTNVTWSSSNTSIATVDANGLVTAVAPGTATITATSVADNTVTATRAITVNPHVVVPGEYTIALNNVFFGCAVGNNSVEQTATESDVTFVAGCSTSASSKTYYDGAHVRFYLGSYLNISAPDGFVITSIVFTADGTWNESGISANVGEYTASTKSWEGEAKEVDFAFTLQCRIKTATVTFEVEPDVAKPSISGMNPFYPSTTITMSIATEGADIVYTLDGEDPIGGDNTYTVPLTLTSTTTVKARGIKGVQLSGIKTKVFTKATPLTVTEALALIPSSGNQKDGQFVEGIICTAPTADPSYGQLTYYISVDGTETNRLQIYNGKGLNNVNFTAKTDVAVGDRVVVYGQLKNYEGTPEMNSGNYIVERIPYAAPASISVDKTSIDLGTIYYENGTRTATFTLTGENLTKTLYINSDKHPVITVSPTSVTPEADGTVNVEVTVTGSSSWLGEKVAKISIVNDGEDPEIFEQNLITVTLNVIEKNEPELSYAQAKDTAYTVGQPYSLQTLINPHNLTGITYSSNSPQYATINASTGEITPVATGQTTITASFAGNGDYKAGSASYVLWVWAPNKLICSGELETKEYELGDNIDPAGLVATVEYDNSTWNPSDATFSFSQDPIVYGQEEVTAYAHWNGMVSDGLSGLVAKMKWHKIAIASGIENGSIKVVQVFNNNDYEVGPSETFAKGKELVVRATPDALYELDKIFINGVEQAETTFTVPAGPETVTVSATFKHVAKQPAGLAWSVTEKTMAYGTNYERFQFPLMTNPNEISWDDITLSSSDPTVAEFGTPTHEGSSWTARVIMHKAGTAVMTASFAGNDEYEAAEVSYTLTIEKADLAASDFYWFQYPDISQVESDTYTFYEYGHSYAYVVTSKINKNTEVHYESSVPAVASVSTSGNPFALRAGTTTIKAIFDGNDQYNAKTIQYTFIVQKASPVITWSGNFTGNSYTFTYGVTDEIPHFGSVTPSGVREEVHFSSSNPAVATIGAEDGYVYYQKQGGTTTIRAYIEESDLVNAAEISYDLTVVPLVELVLEGAGKMTMASQDAQYKDYATTVSLTEDTHYFSIKVNGNTFQKGVTLSRSNASAKIDGYYGTTTSLTADVAGDYTFTWNNKDSVITVTFPNEKLPAELGWNFTEATAYTVGKSYTLPTLLNPHVLMVELSSSNTDVADFEEGQLVLKAAGVTTITATSVETMDFAQGTASYTLNVAAPASLAISGELVKTEYEPEQFIDRTGLVATATYTDGSTLNVTDLATWTIDGNAETQIYNMEDQYSFAAAWEGLSASKVLVVRLKKHAVTFEQSANGTLVITNQGEPIQSGDEFISGVTLVITATPNLGYKLDVLTVNGADMISLGSNEFSIDGEAVTVVAIFVEDTGTGVDNAETGEKVQKVMIDNHIYIIRGGKTYTAEGQLVR